MTQTRNAETPAPKTTDRTPTQVRKFAKNDPRALVQRSTQRAIDEITARQEALKADLKKLRS